MSVGASGGETVPRHQVTADRQDFGAWAQGNLAHLAVTGKNPTLYDAQKILRTVGADDDPQDVFDAAMAQAARWNSFGPTSLSEREALDWLVDEAERDRAWILAALARCREVEPVARDARSLDESENPVAREGGVMKLTNVREDLCSLALLVCGIASLGGCSSAVSFACEGKWMGSAIGASVYACSVGLCAAFERRERAGMVFIMAFMPLCMGLFFGPISAWEAWQKENWTGVAVGAVWFSSFFVVPFFLSNRTAGKIVKLAFSAVLAGLILSRPFALMCAKACGVLCVVALFAGWSKTSMRLAVGSAVCVVFWWLCQRLALIFRRGFGRPR